MLVVRIRVIEFPALDDNELKFAYHSYFQKRRESKCQQA